MKNVNLIILFLLSCIFATAQPTCHVTQYDENNGLSQWHVTQMLQDRRGMMWFSTWNGLNRFDGYDFECFKSRQGDGCNMPTDRIRAIVLDKNDDILCLVDDQYFVFNTRSCLFRKAFLSERKRMSKIESFYHKGKSKNYRYRDIYGTTWLIGRDGSMAYLSNDGGVHRYEANIKMNGVSGFFVDVQKNLWLRSTYGVYKLNFTRKPATIFPQKKSSQIRCFLVDKDKCYWISSKEDATVRCFGRDNRLIGYLGHDGKLYPNYTSFGHPVYSMLQDRHGTYWFGSKPDGLFRLKEISQDRFCLTQFKHQRSNPESLSSNAVYDIKEDAQGRLWIATMGGGINCIQKPSVNGKVCFYTFQGRYPLKQCPKVRSLLLSHRQELLAATTDGLLTADVKSRDLSKVRFYRNVKEANRKSSLSNNATMNILEDHRHRIFVCTESGGVNQIVSSNLLSDRLAFGHFNMTTGLPTDVTLSMVEYRNKLWIVGSGQIIALDPDHNTYDCFDSHFWRDRYRFSDARPLLLPDGRWIFGLMDGAFTITPQRMRKSVFVPPIAITGISIQNREENLAVNALDTLVLKPEDRSLTIRFAALDYSDTGDINYAFRLNGKDKSWNYINKTRSATFLDMPPGKYLLEIKSTNADGIWVDNVRTLTLIVTPTFWETGWAMFLFILLGGTVVSAITYTFLYIRRIKQQQKETLNAYLHVLNSKVDIDEKMAENKEKLKLARLKAEDDAFMQRVMKFVELHLGDSDINMDDMAEATATSRSGLSRRMKAILGVTPAEFIKDARIQKACNMLVESTVSVTEIAFCCGFSNPKYFSRCFKSATNLSPSEYRAAKMNEEI